MSSIPLAARVGGGQTLNPAALQPADIIVSSCIDHGVGISAVIRRETHSPVSHAMLYAGGGEVIEAIADGVVRRTLDPALTEATLAVAYRVAGITRSKAAIVVGHAATHLGAGYDRLGAIGAGARSLNTMTCILVLGAAGCVAARAGRFDRRSRFYCSELVLDAFRQAGIQIVTARPNQSTPRDLVDAYSDGVLEYLGHLKP